MAKTQAEIAKKAKVDVANKKEAPVKSQEEKDAETEIARKAKVDATNKKASADAAKEAKELQDVPLNDDEEAFIARIAPMMNEGRPALQPSSAEILRYSRLIERKNNVSR